VVKLARGFWRLSVFGGGIAYSLAIYWGWGLSWTGCRYWGLGVCLLMIAWIDRRSLLIPDSLQLAVALLSLLRIPVEGKSALINGLWGATAITIPVLLLVLGMNKLLKKETMGGGDLKLLTGLGLHFGAAASWQLLMKACCLALFVLLFRQEEQQEIPFAPYLAAATIFGMF